jgi:hydrogenase/urease accessory protein HupE
LALRKARLALVALAFAASAAPAFAHSAFGTTGPFWSGALHIAVSPLSLATIAGFAAALGPLPRGETALEFLVALVCVAGAAALLPDWSRAAALGAIIAGSVAASGLTPKRPATLALSAVAGLAIGAAAGIDNTNAIAGLGAALAFFLLCGAALAAFQELEPRLPIARRVAGAWVAAIGLLLSALLLVQR